MIYVWLGLAALFIFVEAITPAFVSLWFAGGALISMMVAVFGGPLWLQVVIFVVASLALLLITRPLYDKYIKTRIVPTNLDSLTGLVAIVTERIDNVSYQGEAKVKGRVWTARTEDGSEAEVGEQRKVVRIEGSHLILSKTIDKKEN